MAQRNIVWTETAAKQRREIFKYWTKRNKSDSYAKKLINIIKEKTELIADYPESGIETEMVNIRMSAMGHFSIFYKHDSEQIIIVAFWDNRQDPKKLFELVSK